VSHPKRRPVLDLSKLSGARRPARRSNVKAVSRGKSGHVRGRMNGLERQYAELLDIELAAGRILKWRFESVTFVLARPPAGGKAVTWTPDFWVQRADGTIELVDTKGMDTEAQRAKVKICAEHWEEFHVIVARRSKQGWTREVIG
jgi:hypothetical protein